MSDQGIDSIRPDAGSRLPMPRRRVALRLGVPIVIIGAAALLLISTSWDMIRSRKEVRAVTVGLRTVEISEPLAEDRERTVAVQAPGWVEPDPFDTFVSALTDGVVEEILVLEGDRVEAGQAIARLIPDDAELDVRRARATLDEKRGRLARATAALEAAQVHRTELVEPDLVVKVAEADLARVRAELAGIAPRRAALEATRSEVRDEYERKRKVVESGAVPEGPVIRLGIRIESIDAQLRGLDAEEAAVTARVEAAEAEAWGARRIRELLIAETLAVSSAEAEIDIARGEVEMATVALDRAQLRLDRCTVRTPVAGVVIERLTSPGSKLMFGDGPHTAHVVHLYDPENLQVRADVPLADAARVGVGQRAEIVVDLLPDTVFEGSVTRFVHRADLAKNTVEAKVRIDDPSPLLKPDMLARVRILEATENDAGDDLRRTDTRVFAPVDAIDDGRVWVVAERDGDRGVARRVGVSVGPKVEDGWVEVLDGLRPGDMVILEDTTIEGEAIRIRPEGLEVQS